MGGGQKNDCLAHLHIERPHRSVVGSAENERPARVHHHTPYPVLVEVLVRVTKRERERQRDERENGKEKKSKRE